MLFYLANDIKFHSFVLYSTISEWNQHKLTRVTVENIGLKTVRRPAPP